MTSQQKDRYILSINGGGVRGMAVVQFMIRIEEYFGISIYDKFDMFIGTSCGAMIASSMCVNKTSAKVCSNTMFTTSNICRIMPKSIWDCILPFQFMSKFSGVGKRAVINECIPDVDFASLDKPLYAMTYNINTRLPVVHGGPDNTAMIRDVIDASSAAPTYFPPVRVRYTKKPCSKNDLCWEIDGGVAANNPSGVALSKAVELWGIDNAVKNTRILSIGTGFETEFISGKHARRWGPIRWLTRGHLINIMLGAPTKYTVIGNDLILGERYLHVDTTLSTVNEDMDDTSPENIKNLIQMGDDMFVSNLDLLKKFFMANE